MHIYHHLWNSRSFLLAPSYNTSYCQAPHPTPPPLFHQHGQYHMGHRDRQKIFHDLSLLHIYLLISHILMGKEDTGTLESRATAHCMNRGRSAGACEVHNTHCSVVRAQVLPRYDLTRHWWHHHHRGSPLPAWDWYHESPHACSILIHPCHSLHVMYICMVPQPPGREIVIVLRISFGSYPPIWSIV